MTGQREETATMTETPDQEAAIEVHDPEADEFFSRPTLSFDELEERPRKADDDA
jgi:hypothetical protein